MIIISPLSTSLGQYYASFEGDTKWIFPQKAIHIKFWGFLEYIASELHNSGQFLQDSILFHSCHFELKITNWIQSTSKVPLKKTSAFFYFHWFYKAFLTLLEFHSNTLFICWKKERRGAKIQVQKKGFTS